LGEKEMASFKAEKAGVLTDIKTIRSKCFPSLSSVAKRKEKTQRTEAPSKEDEEILDYCVSKLKLFDLGS